MLRIEVCMFKSWILSICRITKPDPQAAHFNREYGGTCSFETSVSTYKTTRCHNLNPLFILKDSVDYVSHSGVLDFWTSSIVQYSEKYDVSENRICLRTQVTRWETPILLVQWSRLALSNGFARVVVFHPFTLRTETHPVSETLCSLEYRTMDGV
jgi:hypothetical protein